MTARRARPLILSPASGRQRSTGWLLLQVHDDSGHQQPEPTKESQCSRHYPGQRSVHLGLLGIVRLVADWHRVAELRLAVGGAECRGEHHRAAVRRGEPHPSVVEGVRYEGGGPGADAAAADPLLYAYHGALGRDPSLEPRTGAQRWEQQDQRDRHAIDREEHAPGVPAKPSPRPRRHEDDSSEQDEGPRQPGLSWQPDLSHGSVLDGTDGGAVAAIVGLWTGDHKLHVVHRRSALALPRIGLVKCQSTSETDH